jgi:hypothetical protein
MLDCESFGECDVTLPRLADTWKFAEAGQISERESRYSEVRKHRAGTPSEDAAHANTCCAGIRGHLRELALRCRAHSARQPRRHHYRL